MSRLPAMLEITAMLVVAILVIFSGSSASKSYLGNSGQESFASGNSVDTNGAPLDDGWRRTSAGWERASRWHKPGVLAADFTPLNKRSNQLFYQELFHPKVRPLRLCMHPAGLVCLQLLVVAIGFVLFPSQASQQQRPSPQVTRESHPQLI